MKKLFTVLVCSFFVFACSTTGNYQATKTTKEQLSEMFVVGKTTELQVSGKLGTPDRVKKLNSGEIWEYESEQHASVILLPIGFTTKTKLVFTFDNDGTMQSMDKLEAKETDGI